MKLESIHIKNYKLFKDLEIPKLGQVNLITGRNNTGKTILLEALRIWASEGDASVINNIIWKRGDWDESSAEKTYKSLFSETTKNRISINNLQLILSKKAGYRNFYASYEKAKRIDVTQEGSDKDDPYEEDSEREGSRMIQMNYGDNKYPDDKAIFISASIDFNNKSLWKDIVFNRKRKDVVKVLQTIDEKISDIEIVDNKAFIGLEDSPNLILLKNFGEGLNRLLTIAMALVSAEDNLLLIDEIDTGLHYSVLEKLWEIIFEYAKQLNVQVFVTTHSGDCVNAFSTIANRKEWEGMGNYFRLSRKKEDIIAVEYDIDELEMALESNIETR